MPEKRKANKIQATPGVSSMSAMEKSNDLKKAYSDFFVYISWNFIFTKNIFCK